MKRILIYILLLIILAVIWIFHSKFMEHQPITEHKQQIQPNILVLSFCSLRERSLAPYNPLIVTTPNILNFSKKSYIFKNGISGTSWTNALNFVEGIPNSFFEEHGYQLPGLYMGGKYIRIPRRKGLELEYTPDLEYLKQLLLTQRHRPFYLGVHIKYQHFPYFDRVHQESSEIYSNISNTSKKQLINYQAAPLAFPEKLSLFTLLFRDRNLIISNPIVEAFIRKTPNQFNRAEPFGIINNQTLLSKWRNSQGYPQDIKLLEEVYDAKLSHLDNVIGPILNLYNDEDLQKNTIIIFVGDHGDALMEHNHLYHGDTVYDEMIKFPLIVRFPNSKMSELIRIKDQFFQGEVSEMIKLLATGTINENNFLEKIQYQIKKSEVIVSRTCNGDEKSIRYQNKWKLIKNFVTKKDLLFNIQNDPQEKNDVYSKNKNIIGKLEELFIENDIQPDTEWNINCSAGQ